MGIVSKIGHLESKEIPAKDGRPAYTMKSRRIQLQSGEFHEDLELLGKATDTQCRIGDVLAVHKCKSKEYNNRRKLTTGMLTFLEVNPSGRAVTAPEAPPQDTPTKKATRSTTLLPLPIQGARSFIQRFLADYQEARATAEEKRNCLIIGKYRKYDESIFETYPFHGADNAPQVRINGVIYDSRGELRGVIFWNDAAEVLFQSDAATLLGLWEGCDQEQQKKAFLETLDRHSDREFKFFCRVKLFQPTGANRDRARVDINVDTVDPVIDADEL